MVSVGCVGSHSQCGGLGVEVFVLSHDHCTGGYVLSHGCALRVSR